MSNDFFNASGNPAQGSPGSSQVMRDEFSAVEGGFDKLPPVSGNAGKRVRVNDAGNALTVGLSSESKLATADQVINNSTAFTDDDHLFGFDLEAGGIYRVDGMLLFETANATPDVKLMFVAPEEPLVHEIRILFDDANDPGTPESVQTGEGVSSERLGLSTTEPNIFWLSGVVFAHASNDTTWTLQWAQFEATVADVTRKSGSHIELTRLA